MNDVVIFMVEGFFRFIFLFLNLVVSFYLCTLHLPSDGMHCYAVSFFIFSVI